MVLYSKSVIRVYFGSEDKYWGALKQKHKKQPFSRNYFIIRGFSP